MKLNMLKDMAEAIKQQNKTTEAYDTTATVVRTEGNTAWVHIPGGVDETPVEMGINANVGDAVRVRVAGGQAWMTGNTTAPPTDDTEANEAKKKASAAFVRATTASEDAETAALAAQNAMNSAMQAETAAVEAQTSAGVANQAAGTAIHQLSIVENVVGTLNWIREHGTYALTTDTTITTGKYYFTRSGSGTAEDPYIYTIVTEPAEDPAAAGYYELDSIDAAVSNYIQTHVALTDEGLWLQTDNEGSRILVSPARGVIIYGASGQIVASYGDTAIIGEANGFHIEIDGTELGFYEGETRVAYINNNTLHIAQSVVLNEMQLGENKWVWKLDPNDDSIYLKWIG